MIDDKKFERPHCKLINDYYFEAPFTQIPATLNLKIVNNITPFLQV